MNQDIVTLFRKYLDQHCSKEELETVLSIIEAGTFFEEWDLALTKDAEQLFDAKDGNSVQAAVREKVAKETNAKDGNSVQAAVREKVSKETNPKDGNSVQAAVREKVAKETNAKDGNSVQTAAREKVAKGKNAGERDSVEKIVKQTATTSTIPLRNELSSIRLHHRLMTSIQYEENNLQRKSLSLVWKRVSIAAAATLLLFFGWYFFNYNPGGKASLYTQSVKADIAPGKNGAKLRLANGEVISLDGAKTGVVVNGEQFSYNDGTAIKLSDETTAGAEYTAITDNGNMYSLTLSDGTQVWLNAGSQLDFPAQFDPHRRQVRLKGEAFFKVTKDKSRPFIVESKGQQVEVLGTEFNINSYADEQVTKTTLVSGSIRISGAQADFLMKPGQQASLDAQGALSIADADTTLATAWKNNKFIFEDSDIESVMRMVKRWYNVDVIYSGPIPEVSFGGKISRSENVSSVLHVLEATGALHFKVEGRKIYVFP